MQNTSSQNFNTAPMAALAALQVDDRKSPAATFASSPKPLAAQSTSVALKMRSHPDAALFDLVVALEASEARIDQCDGLVGDAFDRFEPPEIPATLIWQESDTPGVCANPTGLAQYDLGGKLEYVYEDPPAGFARTPQDRRRAREIIAAVADWYAATERAEAAAGLPAASEASERAYKDHAVLERRLVTTRARTIEGLVTKVQAISAARFPANAEVLRQKLQEGLATEDSDIGKLFQVSLALDVLTMGNSEEIAA